MSITSNVELSISIVKEWISGISNQAKHTIYETPTFSQLIYTKKEGVELTINFVLQSENKVTILFIFPTKNVNESINIEFNETLKLSLPTNTVPSEYKETFLKHVRSQEELIKTVLNNSGIAQQSETEGTSRKINTQPASEQREAQIEETRVKTAKLPSLGFSVESAPRGGNRPPDMPDFEDEYEMLPKDAQPYQRDIVPTIGDEDRNPPGIGRTPQELFDPRVGISGAPGTRGDGGMHPSLDHPLFRRGDRRIPPHPFAPGVPPGARFDDPTGGGLGGNGFDGPAGPGFGNSNFGGGHSGAGSGFGGLSFGF